MTLKTAKNTEAVILWILYILMLPIGIIIIIISLIYEVLSWIVKGRDYIAFKTGNKLMHMSDAVKDGTIKNPYCLKHYTARAAWMQLKRAEKSGREAII